jgi:Carboxypeptidase regulatory-like domain
MRPETIFRLLPGVVLGLCSLLLLQVNVVQADNLYASIRGTVSDQSGAGVPGVTVTATNTATGVSQQVTTSHDGSYSFLQLAIGDYSVRAEKTGFQAFTATRVHLDVNTVYVQDIRLSVGTISQEVTVQANQVQVETTTPQLGTVIDSNQIVNMPLIGRNFVNLQALEPGVVGASDRFGTINFNYATNGAQSQMNVYLIDGTDTGDIAQNTPNFIPSPDAIAEFRMVTSTLNPEFARSSGAILNALIKSGTNSFHGDVFDFYRDASLLDSANYFATPHLPSPYQQNQFGATIGGPVIKNHTFFFFSYQGIRAGQPQTNPAGPNLITNVYTASQRAGDFGAGAFASSTNSSPFPLWGDPCPTSGPKCPTGTPFSTLFASGTIPTQDFNPISAAMLNKYVPLPNVGTFQYSFNATQPTSDNQYIARIDHTFNSKDSLWGTWFQEALKSSDTIPFAGATLPGFAMTNDEHWKYVTVSWTHIFNDHLLNELRAGWDRFNYPSVYPQTPQLPSSAGFSIIPQIPSAAGLPVMSVAGAFTIGFSEDGPQPRIDSVYQGVDNLQLLKGRHTLKFGFDWRRFYNIQPFFAFANSGFYSFAPTGVYSTGNAGADFLLGIPAFYVQGSGSVLDDRADQYYSYAQDQFKLRPNLTLIFGTSWVIDTPMTNFAFDGHAQVAFRPGVQSTTFPGAPVGVVYRGDPGVNAAGRVRYGQLGPRLGFAWSPDAGWLSGGPGKMSLRGGFGIYYDRSDGEQNLQVLGIAPFALSTAFGPAPGGYNPGFATPFVDIATGAVEPNPYPFKGFPSTVDFLTTPGLTPIWGSCCSALSPDTRDPMVMNYNLTLERQLSASAILSLGYVGSESRYLTYSLPVNFPTDAAGDTPYPLAVYGAIDTLYSGANGNYNAFEATLNQHLSHRLQYLVSYTYSHSIDEASSYENSAFAGLFGGTGGFGGFGSIRASNPYCFPSCDYASSSYDARQRLVISYFYQLPGMGSMWLSRLTKGWTVAGITTFQTGFPLDVVDSSLPGGGYAPISAFSDNTSWEGPNQVAPVTYSNPRTGGANVWFSKSSFAQVACAPSCSAAGVPPSSVVAYGDAPRNLMRGPGINNWDFQLYKDTQITESTRLELRMEAYNVFNHTQFDPQFVITDINNPSFGTVTGAYNPRRVQLAAKFYF